MSSWNNQSKQSALTATNASKSSTSWAPYVKGGQGLPYDSPATYNDDLDPISGNPLLYNSAGTTPTWANQNKS